MLEFYSSSTKWCHEYLPSLTIEIRRKSTSRLKYLDEKLSGKLIRSTCLVELINLTLQNDISSSSKFETFASKQGKIELHILD